jgi:Domain of unknown function (DUF4288)
MGAGRRMTYIPHGAQWYIAEIIEEIVVEGDSRNVVHKNLVLIRSDSPDDAYAKALEIGHQGEGSYTNPSGRLVSTRFRCLGHLDVIHDSLEHGAELLYERKTAVPEEEIQKWLLTREQLPLFRESQPPPDYPDYGSKDILEEAKAIADSDREC